MVNLITVQKDNHEIGTKPRPESWSKFFAAMLVIGIFEFLYLIYIPPHLKHTGIYNFFYSIFTLFFIPNLIVGPLAFLWYGTYYSPAGKRLTCFSIAAILSVVAIYLGFNPVRSPMPDFSDGSFIVGIVEVPIIWILANRVNRILAWVQTGYVDEVKPRVVSTGGVIAITVLVILMVLFLIPMPMSSRRAAWMSRAKGTLRSTGSSQLAYQGTNNAKDFGSFQAMKDTLYIAEGYNLGNMIENYSMTWAVHNSPGNLDMDSGYYGISGFTIVAYPRDSYPGYLLTFGVTEDQIVREYNPENTAEGLNEFNGLDDPRVSTWDSMEY
jgi:hypothetical protein